MKTLKRLVPLVLVAMVLSITFATPAEAVTDTTCWGDGCTGLTANRHGVQVTVTAWGYSYTPGTYVWVQINAYGAGGVVLFSNRIKYKVASYGRTQNMIVFVDCNVALHVSAWTWRAGVNKLPQADVIV